MSASRRLISSLAIVALGLGAAGLLAQERYDPARSDLPSGRPPVSWTEPLGEDLPVFVSVVEGYVELDRAGQVSRDIENVPLQAGDRLRTTRGRAELLWHDGGSVALDEHTTMAIASTVELDLQGGRLRARWSARNADGDLVVQTAAGRMTTRAGGDYRVTLAASRRGEPEIEVAVASGSAELANARGTTVVREGTRALTVAEYAPSLPYRFVTPRDEFERWTDDLERDRYGVESDRYLPVQLRYYGGVFDRYGSWRHHSTHGWVWYPRVGLGWRPYESGRWSFVVGFGYSFVGGSRWSWPTHHYGRWDCVGTTWFWVPAPPTHRRAVGFASPRRSYSTPATYYDRPSFNRSQDRVAPRTFSAGPSSPAVPRRPETTAPRSEPTSRAPARREPSQSEPTRTAPSRTQPQRSAPPTARSGRPDRPAPSAATPPASGSRSPSRSSGGSTTGTAHRRGGG